MFSLANRIRIINGSNPHTGRVEVYINGTGGLDNAQWNNICGDFLWSFYDARVVCRQLGYQDALNVLLGKYGQGTGPLWLNGVQCNGTEADLLTCRHNGTGYYYSCYGGGAAAVECLGTPWGSLLLYIITVILCNHLVDCKFKFLL